VCTTNNARLHKAHRALRGTSRDPQGAGSGSASPNVDTNQGVTLAVVIYLPDDHRERAMATKQFTPPNPRQPTASEAMRPTDSSNFYRCDQCPALSDAALAARYKLDAAQLHDLALQLLDRSNTLV